MEVFRKFGFGRFHVGKTVFSRWKALCGFVKDAASSLQIKDAANVLKYLTAYFFPTLCLRNLKMFLTSVFVLSFRILHFQLLPLSRLTLFSLL